MTSETVVQSAPLTFAHIGDLHINNSKEQNYIDLLCIIAQLETHCAGQLDFIYIPGDIADHGLPAQYQLVATALKMLSVPVHMIPGDHDMEQGDLGSFYSGLQQERLPKALSIKNYRCIFVDSSGPGKGGPDFRTGKGQLRWLEKELAAAQLLGETNLLFMHTYPDDLADSQEKSTLNQLIAKYKVALVDMGHTHYNELANDGSTIFSATRSTGQVEEGPVGYSLITVNNGIVSWRFKQLQDPFPFVMITKPADYRLIRNEQQFVQQRTEIVAIVYSLYPVGPIYCRINNDEKIPMLFNKNTNAWHAVLKLPDTELISIVVEAVDQNGWPGQHAIVAATAAHTLFQRHPNGSDSASIGAWPENHIFGTQLGPNRNAKPQ